MEKLTGSPACVCDLIVPSFPRSRFVLSSLPYELISKSEKRLHYYLSNGCQLNAYIRSNYTDSIFPKSGEGLYFEIRGQMTIVAVLQVAQFLRLYSEPYFDAEPKLLLEVDGNSTSQSALPLQDNTRISLLRSLCSEMSYESADSLREILLNFTTLNLRNLFLWLKNFELKENYVRNGLLLKIRALRFNVQCQKYPQPVNHKIEEQKDPAKKYTEIFSTMM